MHLTCTHINESYTATVTDLHSHTNTVSTHTQCHTHTHTHSVGPTVVGAGSGVFGAGLADDVLVDLVPFIFIVTAGEQQKKSLL